MVVTAIIKDKDEEYEIQFNLKDNVTDKEMIDKAFELGMNKYGDFDSVEIVDTEKEKLDEC